MDFWETTSGLFSYSATLSSTVDPCGLSSTVPLYLAVCSVLLPPEECVRGFFRETTSESFPYSSLVGSTVDSCFRQSRGDTTGAVLGQGYDVFYACPVETTSKMNVSFTFRGGDEALEKKFSLEAKWVKFFALAGHRSVDGCRASLYNGLLLERVEALCSFMKFFLDAGFTGDDTSRAVFLVCLHAQDARHFGRHGPEGQLCSAEESCGSSTFHSRHRGRSPWSL